MTLQPHLCVDIIAVYASVWGGLALLLEGCGPSHTQQMNHLY